MEKMQFRDTRKYIYHYHNTYYSYINNFKKNPYTWLKSRFYMETSAILVFLLLKTNIKPNTVTLIYAFCGIVGGILLAIPTKATILMALFIFFTKSILDWSDGSLARITHQTSLVGNVLDNYGALLNDLGLQIGLGFYVALKTGCFLFYYLIPLIPFFYAAGLISYSHRILFEEILTNNNIVNRTQKNADVATYHKVSKNIKASVLGKYKKYFEFFSAVLDARARNVDFICLLIMIEMFTNFSVTWIIFTVFVVKGFISFVGGYYVTIKKDWIEKSLDATLYNIKNSLKGDK